MNCTKMNEVNHGLISNISFGVGHELSQQLFKMIKTNIIQNEFQKYFQSEEVLLCSTSMRTNLHSLVIGNFLII
jgi:hypothetical protein